MVKYEYLLLFGFKAFSLNWNLLLVLVQILPNTILLLDSEVEAIICARF